MYIYIFTQEAQCNISHAFHIILHGITSLVQTLGIRLPLSSPPPGEIDLRWGQRPCMVRKDPSDPAHRQRDVPVPVTNPWCHGGAARRPRRAPHRHGACHALVLLLPLAMHLDSCPFRATGSAAPPTSVAVPLPWARVRDCGRISWVARPPRRWAIGRPYRQSTSLPGRRAMGLRPFPTPASYQRCCTAALSMSE